MKTSETPPTLHNRNGGFGRHQIWFTAVIALITFTCIAPTLSWMEFSNSMENLNAATSLEIRRGGPVFVPTLEGMPRIEKPPLTAWITSLAIRDATLARLDLRDDLQRDHAYRALAFEIRWPALLAACLSLLAVYSLGDTILGPRGGLISAIICASSYFFLRFARNSTTDVQLMLWVAVANAFLARTILKRASWSNFLGTGVSVGLAFMSKGPVALVQTVVPVLWFLAWRWGTIRGGTFALPRRAEFPMEADPPHTPGQSASAAPDISVHAIILRVSVATSLAIAIALWWFLAVGLGNPQIIHRWLSETNPAGGERISSSSVFEYLVILPFMLPWTAFIIDGWIRSFAETRQGATRAAYALFLFTVAIVVMSCFHDRKDRYVLPLVGAASVLAARGVIAMLDRERRAIPPTAHWITLAVMSLLPLAGMTSHIAQTRDGQPWFSAGFAIGATVAALAIVGVGKFIATRSNRAFATVATGFALMMWLQLVGIRGYAKSREGTSDMRPLAESIRRSIPDAEMFNYRNDGLQKRASVDLSIYLNRVTRWIADPNAIDFKPDRRAVYVTLQNKGEPDPTPAWRWIYFDKVKRDKDWYWAFVRDEVR